MVKGGFVVGNPFGNLSVGRAALSMSLLALCAFFVARHGFAQKPATAKRPTADAGTTSGAAPAKPISADEKSIREGAKRFVEAFNAGDAKGLAALWSEQGEWINESGERISGRDAIAKRYTEYFSQNKGDKIDIALDAVRMLSADTAIEDGQATITSASGAADGRYTVVHVKQNGKWFMASVRESSGQSPSLDTMLADLNWMVGQWSGERLGAEIKVDCRWLGNKAFIEAAYSKQDGEKLVPTAKQIIGLDPRSGRITSWMFGYDGGVAEGVWMPSGGGWAVLFNGASAEGVHTSAVNIMYRVEDALVWRSTNRMVAGERVPDADEIVLKRQSPAVVDNGPATDDAKADKTVE